MRFVVAAFSLASTLALIPPAGFAADVDGKSHGDYRREAQAAYERKDYPAARAAFAAALALRPDSPRYLHNLAALSALTGDDRAALDYLRRLAALGVATAVERDPDLAKLQGTPDFLRVLQLFAANRSPQGEAEVMAELPGRTGIIEGLAFRPRTGDLFLGDVYHRCIWRRDRDGRVTRFSAEDDALFGVFGLAIDEARNTLWAATTALPEIAGYEPEMKGQAALVEFNLATSELRRVVPVPGDGRDHGLGDVLVAPDGTVYATDSLAPIIWQLDPDSEEMVKLVESPEFESLQGLALSDRTLVVADYSNGLFAINLADASVRSLKPPANATLLGIDGLVAVPDGIVGVQNGVTPQRVVRIALSSDLQAITGVTVLAAALPQLTDLTLVTLVDGRPTFVAGAGWDIFDAKKAKQPPAHPVRIFQVNLP